MENKCASAEAYVVEEGPVAEPRSLSFYQAEDPCAALGQRCTQGLIDWLSFALYLRLTLPLLLSHVLSI